MNQRLYDLFSFFENELPKEYEKLDGSREIRKSQVQMAISIAGILSSNSKLRSILIDAPVGTGKTFAVLAPAVYNLREKGNRIIYATSSLNLQAQLKNEELKILQKMGYIKNFIVAKGQTHYICRQRLMNSKKVPRAIYDTLLEFSYKCQTGERAEFEDQFFPLEDDVWEKVQLENQSKCKYCKMHISCPTYEHRCAFNDLKSQVVVTNHNQLIQSVLNKAEDRNPIINYNNAGILIIDEAHDFEDACLNQISKQLPLNSITYFVNRSGIKKQITQHVNRIQREADRKRKELHTGGGRQNLTHECVSALKEINRLLKNYLVKQTVNNIDKLAKTNEVEIETLQETIENALNEKQFASWLDIEEYKESLVVVDRNFNSKTREIINSLLSKNKIVFTSGTLAVEGKFDHLYYSWGGKPPYSTTEMLDTVFQYSKQAIVYLPQNMPDPPGLISDAFEGYCKTLSEEILRLIKITGGRTLVLATSYKQMELLYSYIQPELSKLEINFLKQGTKSVELLTEDFKNDETSTLIGTGSFFAGLSVKGPPLMSVILCKLPFPPGDDPFLDLIAKDCSDREKKELVDFPRMLIKLLQAGGRLIRSIEDFGCFAILDSRIHTKFYSDKIINQLKSLDYQITTELDDVKDFIHSRVGKKGFASYPQYARDKIEILDTLQEEEKEKINSGIEDQQELYNFLQYKDKFSKFEPFAK